MTEYIERDALIDAMQAYQYDAGKDGFAIMALIGIQPTADVAPVVHGEWEAVDRREYDADSCKIICYPKDGIACTHCRYVFKKDALWKKNFCPNCGARMDGDVE